MFGNVSMRKEALNQLGFWDAKEREGALSLVEAVARKTVREDYQKWALMEEASSKKRLGDKGKIGLRREIEILSFSIRWPI